MPKHNSSSIYIWNVTRKEKNKQKEAGIAALKIFTHTVQVILKYFFDQNNNSTEFNTSEVWGPWWGSIDF